ncbi:uncharacterized protein AKAW2_30620S [Aspergillus luchuensis]|uniref:Uncharacterized protein n=1 Tax=Aspergillus kawachii TaxID=1069201 RepID=A0A7R7W6J8_ASPKA|nr:uncharacterized protein AKAW2_30620S [Aspergillus luchuensis]BCR97301.1 hypothetical protein AKAW2_30620S [Aspergillus luchuensis]
MWHCPQQNRPGSQQVKSQGGARRLASGGAEPNLVVPSEWLPSQSQLPSGSLPKVQGGCVCVGGWLLEHLVLQFSRLKPFRVERLRPTAIGCVFTDRWSPAILLLLR